jgi:hypothetical protein
MINNMNKTNWELLEQWAIKKYEKFGSEDWLDLVMLVVSKKVEAERK